MVGYRAAVKYGYSNTRVKAMESNLVSSQDMQEIIRMKDPNSVVLKLLDTEYKEDIEKYADKSDRYMLVDFALNRNIAAKSAQLVNIAPKDKKDFIHAVVAKWDIETIKIIMSAKAKGLGFEDISKSGYAIETAALPMHVIKSAAEQTTVETALETLALDLGKFYYPIIMTALRSYKDDRDVTIASSEMEKEYYNQLILLTKCIGKEDKVTESLIKHDIEIKNILTCIRAKAGKADIEKVKKFLIDYGVTQVSALTDAFSSSQNIEEFVAQVKSFNLSDALEDYKANRQILRFEVDMRMAAYRKHISAIKRSMLSLTSIVAYVYIKEIEVLSLRYAIKAKHYGIENKSIMDLVLAWYQ